MAGKGKPPARCAICGISESDDPTVASATTRDGGNWPPMCGTCFHRAVKTLSKVQSSRHEAAGA